MTKTNFKKRAVAVAVASCLSFAPWLAEAAGLGKLTVLSGLGQPLRAEIEINASRTELTGMSARLASQKAFREAGIDYATALYDLRFAIDKRPNGTPVLKITSSNPVNDPFMDLLVELNWPDGPVVREYTFLLDPPEVAAKAAGRPVSTAEARVVDAARGAPVAAAPAARSEAPRPAATAPKVAAEPRRTQEAGTHVVQQGETLRKIAGETKLEGVSLEQMLVGLYKKNPDAFIGDNINRLKAGAILTIPDKATVAAVSEAEAKQVYQAQATDWSAYRQKLAGAVAQGQAKPEDASQSAAGKITARVDDKAPAAGQPKDQVKVSKAEVPGKGAAGGKSAAVAEEDLIAKDRALKEAQDRLAQLEKNVGELQKLVDMKTQRLAELQQQASGSKDEAKPAAPAAPVEPAKPAAPAEPPKAAEPAPAPAAEPPKVAEAPKPAEEPPKASEAPKPAEPPKASEAPKKEAAAPAPAPAREPESDFDLLPLIGGGGVIALLVGFLLMRRRRSEQEPPMTTTAPGPASLGPNSVFRMTGGQSVDTGNAPLQTGEFSQTGPGTIDTDEVDPVAEADVYMAYGRDAQAEEILIEALRKDPQRTAIHAKLLEIYSGRKSLKQFDTLASELYAQTGGVGADWDKVAAMGAALDPSNPLYSGGKSSVPAASEAAPAKSAADANRSTVVMPGALGAMAAATVAAAEQLTAPELPQDASATTTAEGDYPQTVMDKDVGTLDFDLASPEAKAAETAVESGPVSLPELEALDFDLGTAAREAIVQPVSSGLAEAVSADRDGSHSTTTIVGLDEAGLQQVDFAEPAIDFQLDTAASLSDTVVNPVFASQATNDQTTIVDGSAGMRGAPGAGAEDFDINLSESVFIGQPMMTSDFDMTTINLDLAAESADSTQVVSVADNSGNVAAGSGHHGDDEVGTKLALAKAYEEMGDHSQARELLGEVIAEGSSEQVRQAREMIGRLRG